MDYSIFLCFRQVAKLIIHVSFIHASVELLMPKSGKAESGRCKCKAQDLPKRTSALPCLSSTFRCNTRRFHSLSLSRASFCHPIPPLSTHPTLLQLPRSICDSSYLHISIYRSCDSSHLLREFILTSTLEALRSLVTQPLSPVSTKFSVPVDVTFLEISQIHQDSSRSQHVWKARPVSR